MTKRSPADAAPSVRRNYRVREFAALGGVTVKALLHYDRSGAPGAGPNIGRPSGVFDGDLDRLRRILALKRMGIPLAACEACWMPTRRRWSAPGRRTANFTQDENGFAGRARDCPGRGMPHHRPDDRGGLSRLVDVIDMQREAAGLGRFP